MRLPVYLDYNATTPVAPEVANAIEPYLREAFGNPSSSHAYGRRARQAVAQARAEVAALIGANPLEVVFTGCATEANNLALRGVAHALSPRRRHVVVSAIEHPAILEPALRLRQRGWEVSIASVDSDGYVHPERAAQLVRDDMALVSIIHANNEVGTIQPIAEIAAIAHARGALMHTDAAQSPGKIEVDVDALGVDLLTLAGHKFYATKGVGALYVRRGTPIEADLHGAGQEQGLRPGTENVPAIVGLGAAARLAAQRLPEISPRLLALRDRLHALLVEAIPGLALNGHARERLPNTLNLSFPGVSGRDLLHAVDGDVAASVGSACHSESDTVSGVLAAMGFGAERAMGAVRLSLGAFTDEEEIVHAGHALIRAWKRLYSAKV